MTDLEAQVVAPSLQRENKNTAVPKVSRESALPSGQSPRATADQNSRRSSEDYDGEQAGLYDLAEDLRNREPAVEPWFLEMSRLRRIYILWLNKRLSLCRKSILEQQQASDKDMKALGEVLHLQGKIVEEVLSQRATDLFLAEAIRDLQTVRDLDFLTADEQEEMHALTASYLKKTATSNFADVEPFKTENYRRLHPAKQAVSFDEVREMLRTYLPKQISWSKEEKAMRSDYYQKGIYKPEVLSSLADAIARLIIAMGGALFILVPMYIMSLHQNLTNNLVTTTIAVVLFVLVCSIPLKLANDQIFASTFGYAAVLMVFVGLTSSPQQLSG
jgi:hypothetical protein